jgi:hypothetical protein
MNSYEFSWQEQVKTPYMQKRKWWNIFGSDIIVYRNSWVRKEHTITSPELVEILICNSGMTITELNKLIFTDKTICNLCLTQGARVTEYIPVTKIATSL